VSVPITFTEKVQLAPEESAAPARLTAADRGLAVIAPPPHEPVSPFGDATINPEGKLSVKAMPETVAEAFGFVIVKLRLVAPFIEMKAAPKLSPMTGGMAGWS
jgi:hypothetical protein